MQFLPPAVYDVSTSSFAVDEGSFTATCRRLRDAGFKSTFGHSVEEEKEDDKGGTRVDAGEHVAERLKCRVAEKETPHRQAPTPRGPSSPTWRPSPST